VKENKDVHGTPTGETLYLVRETKGSANSEDLRLRETQKITCGERHFRDALAVDYKVVTSAEEI